jgi:putative transposase
MDLGERATVSVLGPRPGRAVHRHVRRGARWRAGIEVVKIPPRSPAANAYAELWVRTARAKVTDGMLITGPRHLHSVLDEYVAHCNHHRPHRTRDLRLPDASDSSTVPVTDLATARIRRHEVLGGLIRDYEQAA